MINSFIETNHKLTVDIEHLSDGIVRAHTVISTKRYKLRIAYGIKIMTYDLNNRGDWEDFSLQYGDGDYKILLYEQTNNNKYALAGSLSLQVKLSNQSKPFLSKNQYINYSIDLSSIVNKYNNLTREEFFNQTKSYILKNYKYDFLKAATIAKGQLPNIDECFTKKIGICQDLAALFVAIMRAADIPSKLIIGYADDNYHAWSITEIDGKQKFFDPTVEMKAIKHPKKYTVDRIY